MIGPHYNEFFYESCDLIMNISKQTVSIVKDVWKKNPPQDWQVTYLPHGVSEKSFLNRYQYLIRNTKK